jgi:hypothetical protein
MIAYNGGFGSHQQNYPVHTGWPNLIELGAKELWK